MSTKTMTVKFYDVESVEVDLKLYNFQKLFKNKLNGKKISERIQNLSSNEEYKDGYLILSYEDYNKTIFGVFAKFSEENFIHMSNQELNEESLSLEKLTQHEIDDQAGIIKSYSYFCIYNNIVSFSSPRIFKAFERYINWLFEDTNKTFVFKPKLDKLQKHFKLSELKNIEIKDSYFSNTTETDKDIDNMGNSLTKFISYIFSESKTNNFNIKKIDIDKLLTVNISLKMINHKNKNEKIENILKSTIRNISSENLVITTKDNKKHRGDRIEKKSIIHVDMSDKTKLPDENDVKKQLYSEIINMN